MATWDDIGTTPSGRSASAVGTEQASLHPSIGPDNTMTAAAVIVLQFHHDRMRFWEPEARAGRFPEGVHQMRVAVRRMRAALRIFAADLPKDTVRPVRKELRVAGRILGSVRDLDVFRMGALQWQRESGVPLPRLAAAWNRAYDAARADLEEYLEGSHRAALATVLEALATTTDGNGRSAAAAAPGLIAARHHEMNGYRDLAGRPDPAVEQLHRLRISAKRLRYVLEFFSSILGPEAMVAIDELRMLQDHLGALQDAVVAQDLVRGFLASGELAPAGDGAVTDPQPAPGAATYLDSLDETTASVVAAFPDVWRRIAAPEFGTLLEAAIAPLEER